MIAPVPTTYLCEREQCSPQAWNYLLADFAEAGAKHLVLSEGIVRSILSDNSLMVSLPKELAAYGLSFKDSHAIFGRTEILNYPHTEMRESRIMLMKLEINIAADMGIETMTFHPGNDAAEPDIPVQVYQDCLRYALESILPEAEKRKVTICLENSWNYLSRPSVLPPIVKEYDSPYLGLCFDAGHANILSGKGKDNPENAAYSRWKARGLMPEWEPNALETMLPYIVNCHLHDNDAVYDRHLPPGEGIIDWGRTVELLKQAPRLKCIQCEVPLPRTRITAAKLCAAFENLF